MKRLFTILLSMFTFSAIAEVNPSQEYVSIDCPIGDISLLLKKDNTFILELKHWDQQALSHTYSEVLKGTWAFSQEKLSLKSQNMIIYQRSKTPMTVGSNSAQIDSFVWQSSTNSTFADKFTLVERVSIDSLLNGAIQK